MQIITNQLKKEIKKHGTYQFPLLISNEKLSKYESSSFLWHWHPEIEITYITKGEMIYTINSKVYHLCEGQALFGNTNSFHTGCMFKNYDCEYTSITFDSKLIYGYENSIIYLKYVESIIKNFSLYSLYFDLSEEWHNEVINVIKSIVKLNKQKHVFFEIDIIENLHKFWKLVLLNYKVTQELTSHDKRNYDRIRSTLVYIENNYNSKLTLDSIAKHINLSESECSRLFKHYMNMPLFEYILEYRIKKSLIYLSNPKYSIVEVATNVGFNDSNYYSKVFSKINGCSPTKYRQLMIKH
ncbi:helix-turn-helix domain-containing protein [Clostridium butyricum]|jgi:AraC-like DNA-binding protein|uniref:AraC family transcriptional regulator n=1 Tax=Clostridium butyricum TaxID=1492 RepID=UPI003467BA1C